MGEIRKDNLHESLVEYMQTLGLTEEQIKEYMENELELDGLQTESKDLVGAINELFQNVDNGKQLIANAIDDESITKDSTFEAMSNAILNTPKMNFATGTIADVTSFYAFTTQKTVSYNFGCIPKLVMVNIGSIDNVKSPTYNNAKNYVVINFDGTGVAKHHKIQTPNSSNVYIAIVNVNENGFSVNFHNDWGDSPGMSAKNITWYAFY
jgi:hypothetical protein